MTTALPTVLLGRFRVEGVRSRAGGARVLDALDPAAELAVTLVVVEGARWGDAPGPTLLRATRYALGIEAILQPIASGWLGDADGDDPPPSGAGPRALVVAYPRGASTAEALVDAGPTDPARAARVVKAVALALAALHDQGVAHGHLRPELVNLDGERVRVAGFGVAQLALAFGAPRVARDALPIAYRAPELRGATPARAETWSDAWALGVLALELLAGRRVPEHLDVPTPDALGLSLPKGATELLSRALSLAVGSRPRDLRAWSAELERAVLAPGAPRPRADEVGAARPASLPAALATPEPIAESTGVPSGNEPSGSASPPRASTEAEATPETSPHAPAGADAASAGAAGIAPAPSGIAPAPPAPRAAERSAWPIVLALVAGLLLMIGATGAGVAMTISMRHAAPPAAPPSPTLVPGPILAPFSADGGESADAGAKEPLAADDADAGALAPLPRESVTLATGDPTAAIPVDRDTPVWGSPDALVTLVVFGDLDCPHTRRSVGVLRRLKAAFGDDLRLAWHSRPIPQHRHARAAAEVAAALHEARGDAAFWALVARMASESGESTESNLTAWLEAVSKDGGRVSSWLRDARAARAVDADLELAARFDVRATPTFIVNGIRVDGYQTIDSLAGVIRRELGQARGALAQGVARSALYATRTLKNLTDQSEEAPARLCPPVAGAPARGPDDALVTIVEFSDFECPFCKRVQPTLDSVLAGHASEVRLVWRDYPLASHSRARAAASFAREAYARGGAPAFFRVGQLLFGAPALDEPNLSIIARSAGLDEGALLDAAHRDKHARAIDADLALGDQLGVTGTPMFFINGRPLSGAQPARAFEAMIGEELVIARRALAKGLPRSKVYDALCALE
ncbi:MAG: thioredoxin domain-containing protein [Sorangiineae bacterium]|nr:thioredoxin domain-containing protein [Polyangiaceae bacterium]MEB2323736.1 thioredoxin domain-containing protein [Sorangiineae bacterium]